MATTESAVRQRLAEGLVIPACPLALTARRTLDEGRQRALLRYYHAAGVGGVAVAVHTTQFAIRDPKIALLEPVLALAADELEALSATAAVRRSARDPQRRARRMVRIAGVCGRTPQAIREAELAAGLGYDAALVSLGALARATDSELIAHCRTVAAILPVVGFYLQPAAGGRLLGLQFWRRFFEIPSVVAVKIAPFNRYQTIDVLRAAAETGRDDVALYTGNDDNIVMDLLTPFRFRVGTKWVERRIVGGLLGHWAVWTQRAVELHAECRRVVQRRLPVSTQLLRMANEITDANAAFFDAANGFAGCVPGLHEVLRRQGLLANGLCLDSDERLSPGQKEEIDRVYRAYPHLNDDAFVQKHRDAWLAG